MLTKTAIAPDSGRRIWWAGEGMGKEEKREDNAIRLQPFWLPWGWAGPCVTTYPPLLRVGAISNLAKKKKSREEGNQATGIVQKIR